MIAVLILAAGKGTRMNSDLPKVLHAIQGKPLIEHVLHTARRLSPDRIVVIVGHKRDQVVAAVASDGIEFVVQDPQLGTGHAVMQTQPLLNEFAGDVVILSGDVPLLRGETLRRLVLGHRSKNAHVTVLSTTAPDPTGYGRIVRDASGKFSKIVEHREATDDELALREINTGVYCFDARTLFNVLPTVKPENTKGEYYLTDVIQILNDQDCFTQAVNIADFWEVCGINTIDELRAAEDRLKAAEAAL